MKVFTCSSIFLTCALLWADVKGGPDDEQAIRKFIQDGVISTDLDAKQREMKRATTLSKQISWIT